MDEWQAQEQEDWTWQWVETLCFVLCVVMRLDWNGTNILSFFHSFFHSHSYSVCVDVVFDAVCWFQTNQGVLLLMTMFVCVIK